jgi:hypothetical protein
VVFTLFTRLTTGLQVSDIHNGLRAMTRRGAAALELRQNRMAHASECLSQIGSSGLRYAAWASGTWSVMTSGNRRGVAGASPGKFCRGRRCFASAVSRSGSDAR